MALSINEYGFITDYLVTECLEEDFSSDLSDKNQLKYEKMLRSVIAGHDRHMPEGDILLGQKNRMGLTWRYYYSYGNWFVDQSKFYALLKRVEFHGATVLCAPEAMEVPVWLWSYGAVDLWVNGDYAGGIETPVYKPINRAVMTLPLKKGENLVYIRLQNLGVRDTRNLFAIQIPGDERNLLEVSLPDMEHARPLVEAGEWLTGIRLCGGRLQFPGPALAGSQLIYDTKPVDFTKFGERYTKVDIGQADSVELSDITPYVTVAVSAQGTCLSRCFERQELHKLSYTGIRDRKENEKRVYGRIASVGQIPRGDKESFSMYPILARYEAGTVLAEDEAEIYKSLNQIESRRDCSDFLACAMVRFMKLYPMQEALAARCKEVMLNYRYWMDENGSDGMCFWSENHSLMFFVSAYLAGDTYPDDIFKRSGKTGRQMKAQAGERICQWLGDVCEHGFDEFHSGGYTPITFAALLNVIDFGEEKLAGLAWKTADRLLRELAIQTFHGVSIAPMGRVYREVLYPYEQDIQSLVNLIDPSAPDRFSEWVIFLATSRYRIPEDLASCGKEPLSVCYEESNGLICVEKQQDYMLTSVQSPRADGIVRAWENIADREGDMGTFHYVKSLNECFHGTTQFEPGVFGYQQHMWYAALDADTVVFVNHPGGSSETCSVRPGYWYGNGIMPALMQKKNRLYAIYRIPESHPIPFTHLYWPENRFDEEIRKGQWIAGRKDDGMTAVWCSESLTPYDDQLAGCEYRAEGRDTAYVCLCGSRKEYLGLQEFLEACIALKPVYDQEEGCLKAAGDELTYVACENRTQYI